MKQIAELALWFAIPATTLYPVALWMMKHTNISEDAIETGYSLDVATLWLPTAFLVDFLYRRLRFGRVGQRH